MNTPDDEIKFIITGTTQDYETYNYTAHSSSCREWKIHYAKELYYVIFRIVIVIKEWIHTGTEMDIHFGRVITEKKNGTVKTKIKSIDDNKQTEEGQVMYEEDARNIFRKMG